MAVNSQLKTNCNEIYFSNPPFFAIFCFIICTRRQYGNADVFVIPAAGGEVRQITCHISGDDVSGWNWDSRSIYFNSGRMGQAAGFKVSAEGGTPQRVFGNYFFQYDHNLVEHPTSGEIFFNDTWESSNQVQRKRYKGPFNPDIQSYNPKTKQHKKYTDWQGKILGQPSTGMEIFILFRMKPMANTICIHWIIPACRTDRAEKKD